jgi:hypothetical protein
MHVIGFNKFFIQNIISHLIIQQQNAWELFYDFLKGKISWYRSLITNSEI